MRRCSQRKRFCARNQHKNMENAYAQALWKMVEGGMTPLKAVAAIKETLAAHGRTALLPRIARAFARLAEREARKSDVVLTIADEKDEKGAKKAAQEILTKLGLESEGLKTRVDDTVIGGWRLEGKGLLVDHSYKQRLLSMYTRVVSA